MAYEFDYRWTNKSLRGSENTYKQSYWSSLFEEPLEIDPGTQNES